MASLWQSTIDLPQFDRLEHDLKTDVLIIGGGMAGILCAYLLSQSNIDCTVIEANRICSGITKNTTAKITSQHGLIYHKLMRKYGIDYAKLYLYANETAFMKFRSLCKDIDCDFEPKDAFVYSCDNREEIEAEVNTLKRIGFDAEFVPELPLPFRVAGAVKFPNQAQFHPLKFVSAIIPNLRIFENTPARKLSPHTVITDRAAITAQHIIAATHFPFINKHGFYYLKQYQHRSYVLALKNAANMDGMYVDAAKTGMSFRNYYDLLLLGGGGHRTGKQGGNWTELEQFASQVYPHAEIIYKWAAQDCMTLDDVPYIGQYSSKTPHFYVATGFNKWGMTSSMVAAMLLTDKITGKECSYAPVFDPSRSMLHPQLAVNAWEATVNFVKPTLKRCPHLGCALSWNAQEHSWDCPCHGSRFTETGLLIDNPATGDLK